MLSKNEVTLILGKHHNERDVSIFKNYISGNLTNLTLMSKKSKNAKDDNDEKTKEIQMLIKETLSFSHDIKTVLTIISAIEMIPRLLTDADLNSEKKDLILEYISNALEAVNTGTQIAHGYTNYLSTNSKKPRKSNQSLFSMLEPINNIFCKKFKGKIIKEIDASTPMISCHSFEIKKMILNLFSNACQSMEDKKNQEIKIKIWGENNYSFFSITDTGSGISKKDLPHIFKKNFTTKKSGGGLGLAIVKEIVKKHYGKITVHTEENKGTTFIISFPSIKEK